MDREGFKNRLKQYKKAREENPGLKYWEWKNIPKYGDGTNSVDNDSNTSGIKTVFTTDGVNWRKRPTQEQLDAFYKGDIQQLIALAQKAGQLITYSNPSYTLDEVVVTANRPKQNQYSELDFAKDVAGFVPILGDAIDIYDAGKALYKRDYSLAALLGAGLLLPNWIEKGGKYLYKNIRNNWRKFKRNLNIGPNNNRDYFLGEYLPNVYERIAEKELKKVGIEKYEQIPLFDENTMRTVSYQYKNAQLRNELSAKEAIKKILLHNIGKFTPEQLKEINEIFKEDPRYADFIFSHPELNPLDAETVDRFITKQNSFIRGVYSDQDNDELIKSMMTENISDVSKKKGGDRLGTNSTGIYVSNSGEIADRFQRTPGQSVRSDIALLYKKAATDINVPIKERLAAERRRIFPFDIVPGSDRISYLKLVDLGYVAKEAQYTTRLGNKLPGYERSYISKELDQPTLKINDLQTRKTNLDDKQGRWGIGGVQSVPELEDKLFDGLNVGTSYGDYLHLMRTLKSPTLTRSVYNPNWSMARDKFMWKTKSLLQSQIDKRIDLKHKIYNNPYIKIAQNIDLNKGPIIGIGGTITGVGAGIYGIMNSDTAKSRSRLSDAYKDDDFAKFARSFDASQYDSSIDMANDILDQWNKNHPEKQFAEGGEVKGKSIPTQEEYIAQQIAAEKAAALKKSLTRTMPRVPKIVTGEQWNPVTKKVEPIYKEGDSCAYTFADNYGLNWMGCEDFRLNHGKYGWRQIPWESRQPGDAVLIIGDDNDAKHTMMYDSDNAYGQPLFNHSNGGSDESAIRKKAKYPHHNPYLTYEFVGTPADSTRWINDYKKIYGFAEGGEVTGPPTYDDWYTDITTPKLNAFDDAYLHVNINDAAADLHNIAMTLPGYANKWNEYQRSRPKEDPSIDTFVNDLWANENPNNVGYRNGKYYPHKSPEGGKMTIGPGFKLDSGSHGISTKTANRGMTKTRLNQEARKIGKQHLAAVDQFLNYGLTTNPADTVSPQIKMGLMDLRHQVGPLNEWGNLRLAVLEGDLNRIKKESTVTWNDNGKIKVDKRRKKIRDEKYFYYE